MLRNADLLRIVVRRQLRQLRLGVIFSIAIGIAMFLGVDSVGKDIEKHVAKDVSLIGTVTIIIAEFDDYMHDRYPPQAFTARTVEAIRALPGVLHASLSMRWSKSVEMMVGTKTEVLRVQGVDDEFWGVYAISAAEGRLFGREEELARARVCVLGDEMARRLFGKGPYVGRSVTIFNDNYTVVGIAGGVLMRNRADRCFIPLSTALDRLVEGNTLQANRITIRVGQLEDMKPLLDELPGLFYETQRIPEGLVHYEHAKDELGNVSTIIDRVNILLLLGIFAALGLGGFGIWQSSFASVRERTKEIGLQLAMGAERKDILKQFLGESLFGSLLGGLVGIVLGIAGIAALCAAFGLPLPWLSIMVNVPLCLAMAGLVGAVGGVWPAIQAGRMDVASALRFE